MWFGIKKRQIETKYLSVFDGLFLQWNILHMLVYISKVQLHSTFTGIRFVLLCSTDKF